MVWTLIGLMHHLEENISLMYTYLVIIISVIILMFLLVMEIMIDLTFTIEKVCWNCKLRYWRIFAILELYFHVALMTILFLVCHGRTKYAITDLTLSNREGRRY